MTTTETSASTNEVQNIRSGYRYHSDFAFGNLVHIDGDITIRAIVIAIAFYNDREMVLVSYMHNGALQEHWLDVARLTLASAD